MNPGTDFSKYQKVASSATSYVPIRLFTESHGTLAAYIKLSRLGAEG